MTLSGTATPASSEEPRRFLPRAVPIQSFGNGGFRFGDMSHRGSLLCLPSGMHAWTVGSARDFAEATFRPVIEEAERIDLLLLGTGAAIVPLDAALRWCFQEARIGVEIMSTASAARTWNVLMAEGRRVAAALVAVP